MRRKISLILLVSFLVSVSLPLVVGAKAVKVTKYSLLKGKQTGIELKYPKGWTRSNAITATQFSYTFDPPKGGLQIVIGMDDLSAAPMTLNQYIAKQNLFLQGEDIGFTVKKMTTMKFVGLDAKRIETTMLYDDIKISGQQVYTLKGNKIYFGILTSVPANYKNDVKIFDKVLQSVKLK